MELITRSQWGAAAPKARPTSLAKVKGVAVHWEGVKEGINSHDDCMRIVKSIQRYHMGSNGWNDIAYNLLACPHRKVFEGRGIGVQSAANGQDSAGTYKPNQDYWAICWIGGPGDAFTDDVKGAINDGIDYMRQHGAGNEVWPHRHFHPTQCPGEDCTNWIASGRDSSSTAPAPIPQPNNPQPNDDIYSVEAEVAVLPVVKQGSKGQHVRILQGLLVANGRNVSIDGDFGPGTANALRDWQGAVGIGADAICGPVSWRRLLCI